MLLWHGSRLTNWTGILSQGYSFCLFVLVYTHEFCKRSKCNLFHNKPPGLRIAPPEAPATGYMFGKGVYFADMFSKSANYSYPSCAMTTGVLVLCEVVTCPVELFLLQNIKNVILNYQFKQIVFSH